MGRVKRFLAFVFVTGAILVSFTSCMTTVQLNESAIVQAIGIDYADDTFTLTLQIFNPESAGSSTQIDASANNCAVLTTQGKTIDEAVKKSDTIQGKKIFTGHNRLIIIGSDYAKEGIDTVFSYFDRNALTRQNVNVLVADGKASDILSTNIDQSILSAEVIEMMVNNSQDNGYVLKTSYHELAKNMYMYNGSGTVPLIAKVEKEDKAESDSAGKEEGSDEIPSLSQVELKKTVIFSDYKMQGVLDEQKTQALVFLSDEFEFSNIVVDANAYGDEEYDYKATVNVYKNKTKVVPSYENGEFNFEFRIKSEGSADEIILPKGQFVSEDFIKQLESEVENKLKGNCMQALNKIILECKSDVFYLNDRACILNPEVVKAMDNDFYENLDDINFTCHIDFLIDRTGLELLQDNK